LLLENFAGAFPIWLSPVQIKIIPISEKQNVYSGNIKDRLFNSGLRVEIDDRPCSMQAKIRKAQVEKIPYMLIIGNRELEQGVVSIRMRDGEKPGELNLEDFIIRIKAEIGKYK
jgi:threonyl-tRNA synthetase